MTLSHLMVLLMQKCSICEREIHGHPQAKPNEKVVCGSCPLVKMQGGPSGKSVFGVRIDMAKMVTMQIPEPQERVMSDVIVKSNVKNRTILLDGRFPLVFDADGLGKMAIQHMPHLETEMRMRPGRFSIVTEAPPAAVEPEVTIEEVEVVPATVPTVEDIAFELDQSFLSEEKSEEPAKPKKASAKK